MAPGNITGISLLTGPLEAKRMELLLPLLPNDACLSVRLDNARLPAHRRAYADCRADTRAPTRGGSHRSRGRNRAGIRGDRLAWGSRTGRCRKPALQRLPALPVLDLDDSYLVSTGLRDVELLHGLSNGGLLVRRLHRAKRGEHLADEIDARAIAYVGGGLFRRCDLSDRCTFDLGLFVLLVGVV
jgi:hypothetical protein